jgi:hypothetical protein
MKNVKCHVVVVDVVAEEKARPRGSRLVDESSKEVFMMAVLPHSQTDGRIETTSWKRTTLFTTSSFTTAHAIMLRTLG